MFIFIFGIMKKSTAYLNKLLLLLFIATVFLASCKKDNDVVTNRNIHGQVYNMCTDSGLANITVYLNVVTASSSYSASAVSAADGSFTFSNVQVHSSSSYTYNLYIPSKSGIGNGPEIGFDGLDADINKSHITEVLKCNVAPHAQYWQLYFPNTLFTANDTFTMTLEQRTIHKNMPGAIWNAIDNCPCPITTPIHLAGGLGNYWMGWWHVTYDRTKNGIHTVFTDSVYVRSALGTQTDTLLW